MTTLARLSRRAAAAYPRARTAACLCAAALLIAVVGEPLLQAVARDVALAGADNPYFIPGDALRLYVAAPLAAMAVCLAILAPGLVAAYAMARGRDEFGVWALKGFAITVLALTLTPPLAHALGFALTGSGAASMALGALTLAALAALACRERGGDFSTATFKDRAPDIALSLAAPLIALILLAPKFYWEDLNPDGAHLYFAIRQSIATGAVFWPSGTDASLANFPTLNHMTQIPLSAWTMRLAGDSAFALRIVFILSFAPMAAGLMAAIRHNRTLRRPWLAAASVGAALTGYAVTLAFNTSYYPYFADIAMPMAREPTVVAAFIGFALATLMRDRGWAFAFAAFSYAAGPGGLAMLAYWSAALAFVGICEERKASALKHGIFPLAVALTVAAGATVVASAIASAGLAEFGSEFGAKSILQRLRFVSFDNFERVIHWAAACGFAPAACLLWWRGQDREARVFAVFTLAFAAFFYIQAYRILPHHLASVMALPLIVMWRLTGPPGFIGRRAAPLVVAAGLIAGLALAIPQDTTPHLADRQFAAGLAVDPSIGSAPATADLNAFNDAAMKAFPAAQFDENGRLTRQNAGLAWLALAPREVAEARYDFRRGPAPSGFSVIATSGAWTLSARDLDRYAQDRSESLSRARISPHYRIDPVGLFGPAGDACDHSVIDLKAVLQADFGCRRRVRSSGSGAAVSSPGGE